MFELTNFDAIRIGLASPEKIREWSHGEVKKPETINYRTLKPERDGLFCERIFGPTKDWECHCGRYKRIRFKGVVCDKCGVEVTKAKVRRERMGHIELAAPVSHIWYYKSLPCRMKLLLDMSPKDLEKVLYFAEFVVIDPGTTTLTQKQLLTDAELHEAKKNFGEGAFKAGIGAEAIKELLKQLDLNALEAELTEEIKTATGQKRINAIKRLEVIEAFIKSGNKPEWIILDAVPVIPPELRPMVQLDGGRFATSDLNDLYRRVINRNNRLKRLLELHAPDMIIRNEKRMLQEAVDSLIDNGKRGRPVTGPGNRPLKSLSDMLRGKQGRFRQNLLGKRVDYSGRSVIVVGPELKMYQCGLPKEMALELFKPFVMKLLVQNHFAQNIKGARRMVERGTKEVWDILEIVIKDHPVLLNRAPTLHRLGIQAFEPILVEGRALKLHPLVCTAYNADFDGDQMAVHVPLSVEAQAEARFLMLASNNILKPQDGKPVVSPTHDMVMGCYYLTTQRPGAKGECKMLSPDYTPPEDATERFADMLQGSYQSEEAALMAYQMGEISPQALIKVKIKRIIDGIEREKIIPTTVGRLIFNAAIPQDLGYVDRTDPANAFKLEIDRQMLKKDLGNIVDRCYRRHGATATSDLLDRIKSIGFHYSTMSGLTIGFQDITVPQKKYELIEEAEEQIIEIEKYFKSGFLSPEDRKKNVIAIWKKTTEQVTKELMSSLNAFNPIYMMAHSGARGSTNQISQLAGMRGLMSDPSGQTIEVPIKSNFREGLSVLEFFVSSHGGRKGLADTALRTADSGYLTRRLVDVAQDVIIRDEDCFKKNNHEVRGTELESIMDGNKVIEPLSERILGRYAAEDVRHPETGEILAAKNTMIGFDTRDAIIASGLTKVMCRTVLTCESEHGVCAKCYGANLATGNPVDMGEAVGIIAAQAIGEPGTQLTMRTFHTGGVASADDITQGLPRVEEIFEARKPKGLAIIAEKPGMVSFSDNKKKREIVIDFKGDNENPPKLMPYLIPFGSKLRVAEGDYVESGTPLTEGSINPHDILRINGPTSVKKYMLKEVQSVYRLQGVEISDKHIEIIIRQMLRKVHVDDQGDTNLLPGELVDVYRFDRENQKIDIDKGERLATVNNKLLGITKASLATDSFLSAASFQETTRVLTEAAIKGKVDPLVGLKENVIIGKLIPAGIGLKRYRDLDVLEVPGVEKPVRKPLNLMPTPNAPAPKDDDFLFDDAELTDLPQSTSDDEDALEHVDSSDVKAG